MDEREFAKEEGLHQAVTIKLSSDALNLQVLRNILPKIIGIKEDNTNIGQQQVLSLQGGEGQQIVTVKDKFKEDLVVAKAGQNRHGNVDSTGVRTNLKEALKRPDVVGTVHTVASGEENVAGMGLKDLEVQLIERTKGGGPSKTPRDTKGATGASGVGTDGATSAKHAAVAVVEHHENARQEPAAFGSKLEAAVLRQEEQTFDRMLPRIKTWANQVEYEAEEQQVNTLAAISVHDRHEAAPTPGQKQRIENNSGTNQFNTASSKAATRKKNKKVQQVRDTTLKMHHEQDNTSANVLSSSPNTHVFVPSGQKQNASAALSSQQLLKDDKKELSPAAH
ncbi:hypothetical protein A4A49_00942 [Nicotiana attenuata]|uniref:Uncharacterized protein n=1 Tax=Nicotiana attenuata TaxID=49451 RepID=A0A1J6IK31_NICAT|nr:hypothetical protein A4A49_00942 [Nicotiana attenuata]